MEIDNADDFPYNVVNGCSKWRQSMGCMHPALHILSLPLLEWDSSMVIKHKEWPHLLTHFYETTDFLFFVSPLDRTTVQQ